MSKHMLREAWEELCHLKLLPDKEADGGGGVGVAVRAEQGVRQLLQLDL